MSPFRLAVLLLTLITTSFAAEKKAAALSAKPAVDASAARIAKIEAATAQLHDELVARRRDFHMHPELSNREQRTSGIVAEELRKIGFTDIRTGVGKYGVVAVLKGGKPGPVVAVRADMDALPIQEVNDVPYKSQVANVKHACGHDAHTTVGLGVAKVLYGMRQDIPGTVKFIFQPAEEGAPEGEEGGAPFMIKEGALQNPKPQAIFGLHSGPLFEVGTFGVRPGGMLASSDTFKIVVKGKQSHGGYPHQGIDSIVVASNIVQELQTIASRRVRPIDPVVVTIGTIHGGSRFNVIAPEVTMEGTLRTLNNDVRTKVLALMQKIVTEVAAANEAQATLTFMKNPNFVTYNEPSLAEETISVMRAVAGEKNVIMTDPQMGAEDFSYYQNEIPGFFYWLGIANKQKGITAGLHTADFDIDEQALDNGVKMMSNIVVDYLERHAKNAAPAGTSPASFGKKSAQK
jgi:amidohydrolase